MLIIVSGLARCGSSMTMQMLSAGGFNCVGSYPAFEDSRVNDLPLMYRWLFEINGAVKVLNCDQKLPEFVPCKIIWISRDIVQQAKSHIKMYNALIDDGKIKAAKESKRHLKGRIENIKIADRKARRWIYESMLDVIYFKFEDILENPLRVAEAMRDFICFPEFDCEKAALVVVDRNAKRMKGLLEQKQVLNRA